MTSAFRPPLADLLGRPWLPRLILLGSLIFAGMAALGLKSGFDAHQAAHAAEGARTAAALWNLTLARLESRLALGALDPRPESDIDRFQREAAALRKDFPGTLEEALLYALPAEPPPRPSGSGPVVASVAPGLPRGGPERLGEPLPSAYAQTVEGGVSGIALWAEADPAGGTPRLIVLALHADSDGSLRAVQAYRFDAQRLAEQSVGPAWAPQFLAQVAGETRNAGEALVPLTRPDGWMLRLTVPTGPADWQALLPWLAALLVGAVGTLVAVLLQRQHDAADFAMTFARNATQASVFNQGRLLDFIDLSADWLWETDADHRFTLVTGGILSVTRLDPREYLGKHRWDLPYLDVDAAFWAEHKAQMDRHEPVHLTLARPNLDGELRYLEITGKPMFEGERFLGYRGVGRDVTEQHLAEEALRASEARFRDLVELSSDWYWELDAKFRYTALSSNPQNRRPTQFSKLLGRTPWEVVGASVTDPAWTSHIDILMRHQAFNSFVYAGIWFDGQPIWFSVSGRPLFDAAGAFLGYRGVSTDITEEWTAKNALSESETRYRNTFEHAPVGIATLSPGGTWQSVNDTLAEILGYRRVELVGQPYLKLTHPDDQVQDRFDLGQLAGGQATNASREKRFLARDGSVVWGRVTLSAQHDAYGTTRSLICVVEDITDRMAALQALRSSEERYRRLVELAPDGVFVQREGLIQFANPAIVRVLGAASDAELVGRRFLELIDERFRAGEEERLQTLAGSEGGSVPPHHLRLIRLDGRGIDVEASAVGVDLENRPAVLCMVRDITERLSASRALMESQSRYQELVESVNEVIFQTDRKGRFNFLNQAWEQTTGFTVERSLGHGLVDFIHPDDRGRARAALEEVLGSGPGDPSAEMRAELRLRTKDGQIRWIEAAMRQAPQGSGENGGRASAGMGGLVGGVSGSLDDITSRKIAELTLKNLNQELEARVRLRTAELESSNQELEAFSYSVSHDLRSPLRAIDGFAHILEEDYAEHIDPAGRAYLTRIRSAAHRMAELIDDLIELARLTRQPLHREVVDVSELAGQIIDELRAEAPQRLVDVQITPKLTATADRALLSVVLENLLRNAWKFTSHAIPARISLSADRVDGKRAFCVEDNGVGFDMAFANKLFRPFHRLHSAAEFAGSGIGLATVQRIIQRHGGKTWAESAPGEGARFFFTLG